MATLNLGHVKGSVWYTGTGLDGQNYTGTVFEASGVPHAYVHDMYLSNNGSGSFYECIQAGEPSEAMWRYVGSLLGPMPKLEDGFKSTDTEKALSANAGRRLYETLQAAGLFPKEVQIRDDREVYTIKVDIENKTTVLKIDDESGVSGRYQYTASGKDEKASLTIAIGKNIGMTAGSVLKKITSTATYIYQVVLYGKDNKVLDTLVPDIWTEMRIAQDYMDEESFVSEETGSGTTVNYKTLTIRKMMKRIKGIETWAHFFPITHAKAVWWNKQGNVTIFDKVKELIEKITNTGKEITTIKNNLPISETAGIVFDSWITDAGESNVFAFGNVVVINFSFGSNAGLSGWGDIGLCNLVDAKSELMNAAVTANGVLVDQQTGKCIDCYIYAGQNRVFVNARGNTVGADSWLRGNLIFRI